MDLRIVLAAATAAGLLYLVLLCPEAYWGDSASLSSRLDTVPKPFTRSYWLYKRSALALTVLGLERALAANLVSALYGALGVGLTAALIQRLGGGRFGALVGAGTLAVAHTWWSMSEVAEVYTLHGVLLLLLLFLAQGRRRGELFALGLVAGLALNHHRMLWPALPIVVGFAGWRVPEQRKALAAGCLIGALPWLALCVAMPPSSLSPPEGVSAGTLWLQRLLFGGRSSAGEFLGAGESPPSTLLRMARYVVLNLPGPALLLALPGSRALLRRDRGTLALLLGLGAVAIALAFGLRWTADVHVYLVTLYPLVATLAGVGAGSIERRSLAWGTGALAVLGPPVLYASLAFTSVPVPGLSQLNEPERAEALWPGRRGWQRGSELWERLDRHLPEGALVLPRWREGTVLEYRQDVRGLRADLSVDLSPGRPHVLAEPGRPAVVTWTPPTADVPLDVARLDLLLQGDAPGLRRVVLREW